MKYQELGKEAKEKALCQLRNSIDIEECLLSDVIRYYETMPLLEEEYGFKFTVEELNKMEYSLEKMWSKGPYLKGWVLLSSKFEKAFVSRATKEQYILYYHRRFYQMSNTSNFFLSYEGGDIDSGYLPYIDISEFYNCENCGLKYAECKCGAIRIDEHQYREKDFENGVEARIAESVVELIKEMMSGFCKALLNLIRKEIDRRYSDSNLIGLIEANEWDFDNEGNIN